MDAPVDLPYETNAENMEYLGQQITLLAGQINAANYQFLKLIARFDDCKGWSGGGTVRSCAHWLNWKCGIAMGAAREKIRVAHCLNSLSLIDASFCKGEISYSKVRAMTRVATPQNEDFLLMIAQHGTASHMEQVVGKYQGVQRTMAREAELDRAEAEQQDQRELVSYQDSDGMWIIHARLPAEEGSLVVKAIDAVATQVQAEKREQQLQRDKGVSAEMPTSPDAETFPQSRADALVAMAEHFLATQSNKSDIHGLKGSERCQIMLHVDVNTLRAQQQPADSGPECCHLDNKQWLSPKTARRLACDASLVTVLEDENGKVLNIGRRARTVPASIKRALAVRDETCRFPGCCESKYVDAHHIQHWADGGETSLDNLVTLCRYHHRSLHQGKFTVRVDEAHTKDAESVMVFSLPSGKDIEMSFFPQFPAQSTAPAEEILQEVAPTVESNTCITGWTGEQCDYGMAIDALLQRDGSL